MNNRDYSFKEQDILTNFNDALKRTDIEVAPSFKKAIPSAIDDTVNLLKTDNLPTFDDLGNIRAGIANQPDFQNTIDNDYVQGPGENVGQSNTNKNVRVRTMEGRFPNSVLSASSGSEPVNNNYYSNMNGGYSNENNLNAWRTGGYTETMILIGTGVLVLLVFMVSYLLLNYFG